MPISGNAETICKHTGQKYVLKRPINSKQKNSMKIDFANLQTQYQKYKLDIDASIHSVLKQSNYIMGDQVKQLEGELSLFTGAKFTITCSNGTDALLLALMAIDIKPGDEIITTPFTFISTAESIASLKLNQYL